jgi:archaemetzincin
MPLVLPAKELPQKAWYAPRSRYRADVLIKELRETLPDTLHRVVGLTSVDISTTKEDIEDWGVLGLGYSPGKSCVVSTFRMQKGSVNKFRYKERLRKVVLHELGHTLGLPHCPNTTCLMTDACGSVKTVDAAQEAFCESCKRRLGD